MGKKKKKISSMLVATLFLEIVSKPWTGSGCFRPLYSWLPIPKWYKIQTYMFGQILNKCKARTNICVWTNLVKTCVRANLIQTYVFEQIKKKHMVESHKRICVRANLIKTYVFGWISYKYIGSEKSHREIWFRINVIQT